MKSHHWSYFASFTLATIGLTGLSVPARSAEWIPIPAPAATPAPSKVLLPASRDFNAPAGLPARPLFDNPVRDPHILHAPDGYFYMVATAAKNTLPVSVPARPDSDFWTWNDGIPLWRSKDLVKWETLGYVWQFERDATWSKALKPSPHTGDGKPVRAIWAPEIHFLKGTYWLVYSMNYDGTGLLKSTSGKPEGPYIEMKPSGPISDGIDATIFEDSNGSDYWLDFGYRIARMKPDMSDLAEPMHDLDFVPNPPWGEGINMKKMGDKYVWTNGGRESGSYDCYSATSDSVRGPYTNRYRAIPYAGHNNLFQDKKGGWWSTLFHPNDFLNLGFRPCIVPLSVSKDGLIEPKRAYPRPAWKFMTTAPTGNWTAKSYSDQSWKSGAAGFGDPKIEETGPVTDVATVWKSGDLWLRRRFKTQADSLNPMLFLRNNGPIEMSLNGKLVYSSTGALKDYRSEMLDGVSLPKGDNIVAVHVRSGAALPYFDLGIVDAKERFLLPTAREKVANWRMTLQTPAANWMKTDFNDLSWTSVPGGFGQVPDAAGSTPWKTPDIWLRREFTLKNTNFKNPRLRIAYDDDADVYINGVLAVHLPGFSNGYVDAPMSLASLATLKEGQNTIAVHCHQNNGAQFIDVGIVDKVG
jgi:hypothetical protein